MLCIIRNKIKLHNFMYLPLGCLNRAQLCILPFSSEEVVRTLEISKYQFSILCIETLKMNNCKSLRKIGTFYEKFFNFNKKKTKRRPKIGIWSAFRLKAVKQTIVSALRVLCVLIGL